MARVVGYYQLPEGYILCSSASHHSSNRNGLDRDNIIMHQRRRIIYSLYRIENRK